MSNQNNHLEQFGYKQELHRGLTFWDLVVYGMIFMVPIAPFGIYGYVAQGSNGMVALAYIIGMVGMVFTALSYARMSEAFPIAGSVYVYAQRGINESVGFLAGWAILLDYIMVPSLLYLVSAAALHEVLPSLPIWFWLISFITINTGINIRGIEFTARANKIILVLEIIVLIIFVVLGIGALLKGIGGGFSIKPLFDAPNFSMNMVMSAVSIAVLSFLGFDGISTLAEETKGGNKVVGRATIFALFGVGFLFVIQTWIAANIFPDYTKFSNLDTAFYDVAFLAGGTFLKYLCITATAFSWGIANALAAQAAISRILYSMGRDRNLPHIFAKVHPKFKTPYVSTIFVATISLVVGLFFQNSIGALTSLVNFGALTGFLLLHISVINYYIIRQKSKDYLRHLLLPVIGLLVIGYVWYSLDATSKQLGFAWLAIGVVYLASLTFIFKKKPANMEL
ncbi:amino acid permease-associated region [Desulfotomaculum nigrificans CO-1-SRB]|uniref:Amino acid permease-associated region n=1 Tax=Desulfotomaculum nigrificans (strain DSM 14880 / VKM B-2319 / CO-1-SRB) TaxID=868595 RepID=F6B5A7_DESCC|nr:APC family permease [Desulfotomaculum nigrificans]AEF94228.1 amino acid permease-associated region [Desulfotomaculum nigrificans CO-1-SRB]